MTERDDDRARIRAVLKTISDAWLTGKPQDLERAVAGCFHDNVVFRASNFQKVGEGAAAGIASLQDFMRSATIERCTLGEPQIDLAGDTAIATFSWEMAYEFAGQTLEESGHEIDVLTRNDDDHRWVVRWRAIILAPSVASA